MNDTDAMMHGASSDRGRRRRWPWRAGVLPVAIGVVVLAAACSGRPPSTGSGGSSDAGGSQSSRLLVFAQCMRSHGVPNFPDPTSDLKFPTAQQLGVSSSRYQAAEGACQHLLPNGGSIAPAEAQQMLPAMRRFSQCMRSHGVPNWPDPTIGSDGKPGFDLIGVQPPIDTSSPQFASKEHDCGHLVPSQLGGIPVRQP
jgi:hypothetical protein